MNKSKQREVILDVLRSTKSHPTADWIYERAREAIPNLSLGTVYRNLAQLEENGEIIKVQGVFEKDRYDGNPIRHTHFVCNECGAVSDVESDERLDAIFLRDLNGRRVDDYSVVLSGVCAECLNKLR